MPKPFSLGRNERLKSKKDIDTLFRNGEAFFVFPFKVYFSIQLNSSSKGVKMGVSAPKKVIKRAVDRNYAKRLAREAYRLQKEALINLCTELNMSIKFMLVYTDGEVMNFEKIKHSLSQVIAKLCKKPTHFSS